MFNIQQVNDHFWHAKCCPMTNCMKKNSVIAYLACPWFYLYSPFFFFFLFHLTGRVANHQIILTVHIGLETAFYRYANSKVAAPCQMKKWTIFDCRKQYRNITKGWIRSKCLADLLVMDNPSHILNYDSIFDTKPSNRIKTQNSEIYVIPTYV